MGTRVTLYAFAYAVTFVLASLAISAAFRVISPITAQINYLVLKTILLVVPSLFATVVTAGLFQWRLKREPEPAEIRNLTRAVGAVILALHLFELVVSGTWFGVVQLGPLGLALFAAFYLAVPVLLGMLIFRWLFPRRVRHLLVRPN